MSGSYRMIVSGPDSLKASYDPVHAIDAVSPTVTVEENEEGAVLTTHDLHGTTSAQIYNGEQGPQGEQGNIGPEGPRGPRGETGLPGISPTITVMDIPDGHRVTIVDASGTHVMDIMNGEQGEPGQDYVLTTQDKEEIANDVSGMFRVAVSGTNPTINAKANTRYVCGEVSTINIQPPSTGICDVIFTSGPSVALLTLPNSVKMPDWFDSTALERNHIYEINIVDGMYGAVMSWEI